MRLRVAFLSCALAAVACGGRLRPGPPALFPVGTLWVAPAGDVLEPPLATDGVRIFAATRSATLALDAAGASHWRLEGLTGRLAAAPGIVVLHGEDGTVTGLDPETGAVRWSTPSGISGRLAPVVDRDRVLVAGDGLAALDLASGRVLWSAPAPPEVTAPPLSHGPWVFAGESDGTLRCRDRATGLSVWTRKTGSPILAAPVADERGRLLLGTTSRRFLALDASDEGDVDWGWKVGADVQHAAVVLGDRVLFASLEAVLYALDRGNGHLSWRTPLPSRPLAGPVLVGESVLVACYESEIVGLDGRSGRRLGALRTPSEIGTPPVVVGDRLYVGLRDRTLAAFRLDLTPALIQPSPRPEPARKRRGREG